MNGYGKKMCESTYLANKDTPKCKYENLTEKCVNPNKPNILNAELNEDSSVIDEEFVKSFTQCHEIYNKDPVKMQHMCKSLGCGFKNATDIDDKGIGFCYSIDESERPENFCLSMSNLFYDNVQLAETEDTDDKSKSFKEYCQEDSDLKVDDATGKEVKYYKRKDTESNLDCSMFDNSDYRIDITMENQTKEDSFKSNIASISNQKAMCNNFNSEKKTPSEKCEFVEYQKPLSKQYNSKHDKLTMCVPKNSVKLPNSLITKKSKCQDGSIWSDENEICVNPRLGCNQFKHKETCNLMDTCLWSSGTFGDDSDDNFEFGKCKDISHSLNDIETMMDDLHQNHLNKYVEVSNLEEKLDKILPNIKNNLSSI